MWNNVKDKLPEAFIEVVVVIGSIEKPTITMGWIDEDLKNWEVPEYVSNDVIWWTPYPNFNV